MALDGRAEITNHRRQTSTNCVPGLAFADRQPLSRMNLGSQMAPRMQSTSKGNRMSEPVYNLFTEDARGTPVWLDAVADLEVARTRLMKLASANPGEYFIFNVRTRQIVTSLVSAREVTNVGPRC
jgi:hypothetical protein